MTEPQASETASSSPPTPLASTSQAGLRAGVGARWVVPVVILLALALAWAFVSQNRFKNEAGRRIADLEIQLRNSREAAQHAEAVARAANDKVGLLESRLGEEQGQREALQQLYADLSRGRDDAALVEVDRLVAIAAQELQLAGNVNAALAALQTADARLSRIDNARFMPLRRALARDIEKLKAAPAVDVTGMALKLDALAQSAESWPMLAEAQPLVPAPAKPVAAPRTPEAKPASPLDEAAEGWGRVRAWLSQEFGELVRIREVQAPDSLLIGAAQQRLVRQEVRLRLLDARQALMSRNDRIFRADLAEADALLARYFDVKQASVAAGQAQLRALAKTALSVDLPSVAESAGAARQLRGSVR